jgi:MerR family transcriptional regulator/heat shock protein HspR
MDKLYPTHIMLLPAHTSRTYNEQETILASHLGAGALHHFRALGLIVGTKTGREWRYSEEEVAQLRRIRRLQHDLGANLAGVEVILHLLERLETLQRELAQERQRHEH